MLRLLQVFSDWRTRQLEFTLICYAQCTVLLSHWSIAPLTTIAWTIFCAVLAAASVERHECVEAFFEDDWLCLWVELIGAQLAFIERLNCLGILPDPLPLLEFWLYVGSILVFFMRIVGLNILNADLPSLFFLPSTTPIIGHELVVVYDIAVGKQLQLTSSVNVCQSCSHEGLLDHHARWRRECLRQCMLLGTVDLWFECST